MQYSLECKQLSKFFGGIKALSNVDIKLEKGKIVGLLGPNGARYILKVISTTSAPISTGIRA